ncbi:hypothetical protein DPMN_004063 [Dreissena polymorpha]|uniref:Uncharacterized protein n=1 Tax=Dreissena polymorpha TaxID=45954 RepID=A0A9D4MQ41_DREPO|nr:hypothetical protein DPMN_004063 [Dreissena polymorpha]
MSQSRYFVSSVRGTKASTVHRNHLLPVRLLPLDVTSTSETETSYTHETSDAESDTSNSVLSSASSTSRSVYVPPHKRKPGEPGLLPRRTKRAPKTPAWMRTGDYIV